MTEKIEDLRQKVRKTDIIKLARKLKLHYNTLYRFALGKHSNLTLSTFTKIEEYFNDNKTEV